MQGMIGTTKKLRVKDMWQQIQRGYITHPTDNMLYNLAEKTDDFTQYSILYILEGISISAQLRVSKVLKDLIFYPFHEDSQ